MSKNENNNKKSLLIEKEKTLQLIKELITHPCSVLNTKYSESHTKVAVIYKNHVIVLTGGEEKSVKYLEINFPLSKNEYKEIFNLFMTEAKKRKNDLTLKKFNELESSMKNG